MKTKKIDHVNKQNENDLKLTPEEIKTYPGFATLSIERQDLLKEFVYNISQVLYKIFEDEKS